MLSFLLPPEPLSPGTPAPDFTLRDQSGHAVTLSDFRGRNVVLVFYPHDRTPVCTKQLCEFRDESQLVATWDAVVLGINTGSEESHADFHERLSLPFPLLADRGGHVAKQYHAKAIAWVVRTVYLIGPDGVIRYAKRGKPKPDEVLGAARKSG
jgi:peroxiredoxin Q/BCP